MARGSRRQETLAVLASLAVQAACDASESLDTGVAEGRGYWLLRTRGAQAGAAAASTATDCSRELASDRWKWLLGIIVGIFLGRAPEALRLMGLCPIRRREAQQETDDTQNAGEVQLSEAPQDAEASQSDLQRRLSEASQGVSFSDTRARVESGLRGGVPEDRSHLSLRTRLLKALHTLPVENREYYEMHYASRVEMDDLVADAGERSERNASKGYSRSTSWSQVSVSNPTLGVLQGCAPEVKERLLETRDWNFDTNGFAELPEVKSRPILIMATHLLDREGGALCRIPDWMLRPELGQQPHSVLRERVLAFMGELDGQYGSAFYHNNLHACDVMQKMNFFFENELFQKLLEVRPSTKMLSLLAAAMHDVGHPGTNNAWHIASQSELAIRYNDKSPLENMHAATAFKLMREKPKTDWFGVFCKDYNLKVDGEEKTVPIQSRFRNTIISMVLSTDPANHGCHVQRLTEWLDSGLTKAKDISKGGRPTSQWQTFLLETALHAADIGNCTSKLPLAVHWCTKLYAEFWAQGDLEKKVLGGASMPLYDRDRMDVPGSQVGFIRFVAMGLYEPLASLLPELSCPLRQLRENLSYWEDRKSRGLTGMPPPEERVLPMSARQGLMDSQCGPCDGRSHGVARPRTRRSVASALDCSPGRLLQTNWNRRISTMFAITDSGTQSLPLSFVKKSSDGESS